MAFRARPSRPASPWRPCLAAGVTAATALVSLASAAATGCTARSGPNVTPVIELYTSEGCSSCPPADRWLSRVKSAGPGVALAFHVDYWDRLGWKDRFADARFTERQAQLLRSSGARFSYTPQVILDGIDRPRWSDIDPQAPGRQVARVDLTLSRVGSRYTATARLAPGATAEAAARWTGYWAVTEDAHLSAVGAGENRGATLAHDHVVREYEVIPAWSPSVGAAGPPLEFEPRGTADAAHPRQVHLVVVDARTGRPLQALSAGC